MEKICIAIYDEEAEYVEALTAYISDEKAMGAHAAGFSGEDRLLDYCRGKPPDVLLLGTEISADPAQTGAAMVIRLVIGDESDQDGSLTLPKYQPADDLVRQVMEMYRPSDDGCECGNEAASELISIYDPGQGQLQSPFAVTAAMSLSSERNALYVNFRENAGFLRLFREEYSRDLSDLIFLTGRKGAAFGPLLKGCIYTEQQLQYLPPFMNPADISGFEKEEWMNFVRGLRKSSGYDVIVADISAANPAFYEILKCSERIISPGQTNSYSLAQRRHLESNLALRDLEHISQKIRWKDIRDIPGLFDNEDVLASWFWGELGDMVREELGK